MTRARGKNWGRAAMLIGVMVMFLIGPGTQAFAAPDSGLCAKQAESRALDFWLGEWTIGVPNEHTHAASKVSHELDGCVVVERWDGGGGHVGENMFGYSADDKSWHGMFADSVGHVHVFLNGHAGSDSAEFSGPSRGPHGEAVLNRITIRRTGPDHVQQLWAKSSDDGKTWATVFHGEYARRQP